MHVVAAATLAPPEQRVGQAYAQRLVELIAGTRAVAQALVHRLANAVERLHRRDAVQRLPGVADQRLGRFLVGRLKPGGEYPEILLGDSQRSAADARHEDQLVQRLGSDIGPRGQRESGGAGRRVLQSHDGGGLRLVGTKALCEMVMAEAESEDLLARDMHRWPRHLERIGTIRAGCTCHTALSIRSRNAS